MQVIVAGAGICGLTAARAFLDRGHRVTVLERARGLRTEGGGMTVWHNGAAALDRLGIALEGGRRVGSLALRSGGGRAVGTIDAEENTTRLGAPATAFARADLLANLYAGLPAGTVRFEAAFTAVAEDGRGVVVASADGRTHRGDLLIGADGAHSAVRRALHGAARTPTTGMASCLGIIPAPPFAGPEALFMVGVEGDVGCIPLDGGRLLFWFDVPWTGAPIDEPLELIRDRFARWGAPVPDLLKVLTEADLSVFPHHRHRIPRGLGRGRTTLVGDAAHAMPPHLAQGMNQAFEDLAVLVGELERPPVERALRAYERARRRRTRRASLITTGSVRVSGPGLLMQREGAYRLMSLLPDRAFTLLHRAVIRSISDTV